MHAMGTSLEGETADILALVGELHAVPFELGIPRVYTVLKLDERRDKAQTLEDKVASVRRLLDADLMFEAWEIDLHGHHVVYRIAGSGPPVVLVHGMVNSSRHWRGGRPAPGRAPTR